MNYYPHHIGDFNNATRHLSRIERSIYRDLVELYYDTEKPLTLDIATLCRKIMAKCAEEATAVQQVLNEFFTETATGWYHSRCEQEIFDYHANISAKSAAGKASAAKREAERLKKLNERSTAVEKPLDSVDSSVQLTKNQEPVTIKSKALAQPSACAIAFLTFWEAYPKKRNKGDAEKAWKSIKPDEHLQAIILAAVQRAKTREEWIHSDGQYIPYPASWLNARGWEDGFDLQLSVIKKPDVCACCGAPASKQIMRVWYCREHDQHDARKSA